MPKDEPLWPIYPECPMCGKKDKEPLKYGDESVYECDGCGERYIAEHTDDGIEIDGFVGA